MSCIRYKFVQKEIACPKYTTVVIPKYTTVVIHFFNEKIILKFVPDTFYKGLLIKANSNMLYCLCYLYFYLLSCPSVVVFLFILLSFFYFSFFVVVHYVCMHVYLFVFLLRKKNPERKKKLPCCINYVVKRNCKWGM